MVTVTGCFVESYFVVFDGRSTDSTHKYIDLVVKGGDMLMGVSQ